MAIHNQSTLTGSQGRAPSPLYPPPSTSPPSIDAIGIPPMTCLSAIPVPYTPSMPLGWPLPAVVSPPPPVTSSPPPIFLPPPLPEAMPSLFPAPLSLLCLLYSPHLLCLLVHFGRQWLVCGWHLCGSVLECEGSK